MQRSPHLACFVTEQRNPSLLNEASVQMLKDVPSESEFQEKGLCPSACRGNCTFRAVWLFPHEGRELAYHRPLAPPLPPQSKKEIPMPSGNPNRPTSPHPRY